MNGRVVWYADEMKIIILYRCIKNKYLNAHGHTHTQTHTKTSII